MTGQTKECYLSGQKVTSTQELCHPALVYLLTSSDPLFHITKPSIAFVNFLCVMWPSEAKSILSMVTTLDEKEPADSKTLWLFLKLRLLLSCRFCYPLQSNLRTTALLQSNIVKPPNYQSYLLEFRPRLVWDA